MKKGRLKKRRGKVKAWVAKWTKGAWYSALLISLVLVGLLIFETLTSPKASPPDTATHRKAAIVDQISLLQPNRDFIAKALSYLAEAGFEVDVYKGKDVTIELYKTLPAKGYRLIVFQTHSTSDLQLLDGTITSANPVFLCTSEPYDERKYFYEHMTNQVRGVELPYEHSVVLFSIGPEFVRRSMSGRFENAVIVIGGCQGLSTLDLAEAFIERGASVVISWDGWVDLPHNDKAILHLIHDLTIEKLTVEQAVEKMMEEVGPDPIYKSILTYFPKERGDSIVGNWER